MVVDPEEQSDFERIIEDSDSESEESSSEEEDAFDSSERPAKKKSKKPKKGAVPVMRRHGEPLTVMPDWKHLDAADS